MKHGETIYVAGHNGMVGSAIVRALRSMGYQNLLTVSREHCDLTRQDQVEAWFDSHRIDHVFLAAARVGGIHANNVFGAEFIYDNLTIETNVIHAAYRHGVKSLLFLGSSCIYPRDCPQPMKEEDLLTGALETTNAPYAIAKIAGVKMVEAYNRQYGTRYFAVMPANLYGMNDNYDLNTSHVLPALMHKFVRARQRGETAVSVWGDGTPLREFLFVEDLAEACIFCMERSPEQYLFNVGSGEEVSIRQLAGLVASTVGFEGRIEFDPSMPNGTPRKLLDSSRINELGWRAKTSLSEGLKLTYESFLQTHGEDAIEQASV